MTPGSSPKILEKKSANLSEVPVFLPTIKRALIITGTYHLNKKLDTGTVPKLSLAIENSREMEGLLKDDFGFFDVQVLHNAAKSSVQNVFKKFIDSAKNLGEVKSKGLYFIYYHGHGSEINESVCGYTTEGERIELEEFLKEMASYESTYVVAMLDCCRPKAFPEKTLEALSLDKVPQEGLLGQLYIIQSPKSNNSFHCLDDHSVSPLNITGSFIKHIRSASGSFPRNLDQWEHRKEVIDLRTDALFFRTSFSPDKSPPRRLATLSSSPNIRRKDKGPTFIDYAANGAEQEFQEGEILFIRCKHREAIPFFERSAQKQYPPAYICLGWIYAETGRGSFKQTQKSKDFFEKAKAHHDWFKHELQKPKLPAALLWIYGLFLEFELVHLTEAHSYYEKSAISGYTYGQVTLARCYEKGIGVQQDDSKALEWYQTAAKEGHPIGQANLAYMLSTGQGIPTNNNLAYSWYQKAADQGYPAGQAGVAWCYQHGKGTPLNPELAAVWYQKAAEQDFAPAQSSLGFCYDTGFGVQKNYITAVAWYQKAANQGNETAQANIGNCYMEGTAVVQDFKSAFQWYEKAAENSSAPGKAGLGYCYEQGYGVSQDYKLAVLWYKKAAEMNNVTAICNLGYCYQQGRGVTQDLSQAVALYQKAAEQGYAAAQCSLGECYVDGIGVAANPKEGFKWYQKAANQGFAAGEVGLGFCFEFGVGAPLNKENAAKWYKKAADQGNKFALEGLKRLKNI